MGGTTEQKMPIQQVARVAAKRKLLKTRTGCKTCKIRKVKCDELKPYCKRCSSTGRRCDGYTQPPPVEARQGKPHDQHCTSTAHGQDTLRLFTPAQPEISTDSKELRSYQYFQERTSSELSSPYDEVFWQDIVLQISYQQIALRHAVAALGALHESLNSIYNATIPLSYAESQRHFAWRQCNKAIRLLRDGTGTSPSISVALVASILFSTFEFLENRCESGLDQIDAGEGVLHQWRQSVTTIQTKSELDLVEGHLAPMLARCKNSTTRFLTPTNDIPPLTLMVNWGTRALIEDLGRALPDLFEGVQHARDSLWSLYDVISSSTISMTSVPNHPQLAIAVRKGEELLRAWRIKFAQYREIQMASIPLEDPDRLRTFRKAANVLQIHSYVFSVIVSTLSTEKEDVFDDHLEEFRKIVSLTRTFIELDEEQKKSQGCNLSGRTSFSFDLGVIPPLWVVSSRCRDPGVRREALRLLFLARRREGVWSSVLLAMCVQKLIHIEESGIAEVRVAKDIHLGNRIRVLMIRYEPGRMGTKSSRRYVIIN